MTSEPKRYARDRTAEPRHALRYIVRAEFAVQTREQANELSCLLATLLPDPVDDVLCLNELMFNAIEHGNLELDGAYKAALLRAGRFEDEITRRHGLPPYRDRRVRVTLERREVLEIQIADEGKGFDWRAALEHDLAESTDLNGRGIALVKRRMTLDYRDPGNVVVIRLGARP